MQGLCLDAAIAALQQAPAAEDELFEALLQALQAIVGEKLGGVGPGVSPKMALSLGLKVDAAGNICVATLVTPKVMPPPTRMKACGCLNSCHK